MNVHYCSSPHKKGYGVLLSLQVCSCKSSRLGVVRVTAEEGQSYSPSAHCHTPSHFRGDRGGLAARALDCESEGLEHVERLQFTAGPPPTQPVGFSGPLLFHLRSGPFTHLPKVAVRATRAQPWTLQICGEGVCLWQSWRERPCSCLLFPSWLHPVGEGCGFTPRGQGGGHGGERPGAAPRDPQGPPGLLGPDQAGFLVTFTHVQAWSESAEMPQASVSCLPCSKAWPGPRRISPDV